MKKRILLLTALLVIFLSACQSPPESPAAIPEPEIASVSEEPASAVQEEEIAQPQSEVMEKAPVWEYGGPAIKGNYADSDFVELDDGKYRMYYAIEPEVPENKLEVYSATSSDGINWAAEEGIRRTFAVFPDVIKLPDGTWRMYFQNEGVIKSAASSDGLLWKDENGVRIGIKNNEGLKFENAAGPTTIADGDKYIMAYSGAIPGKYKDAPNNRMSVLMWAASSDGLNFEEKGMIFDTRNDKFYGFADTPDLIRWDDDSIKMFFWGYFGIYESTFTGDGFTEPVMVYEAKKENPMHRFPSSPPGDPTLGKVGEKWHMYYGQHTKGIYYAILEEGSK